MKMRTKEEIKALEARSLESIGKLENTLTKKELNYWKSMKPNSGVVMLKGSPGTAKSAIMLSIATKLNLNFEDLRLSTMDAVDLGSYPYPMIDKDTGIPYLTQLNPHWMVNSVNDTLENSNGTLYFFDELNRASLDVRNAALRILLERTSNGLKLPGFIYQASAGNLGELDGTQVEELDGALRSRLIPFNHDLNLKEWISDYAKENVHPYIIRFLEAKTASYTTDNIEDDVIANARTWTFLSDYIICNYGIKSTPADWIHDVTGKARNYVGVEARKFITWCENNMKVTIKEVMGSKKSDVLKAKLAELTSLELADLIIDLKDIDLNKISDSRYQNALILIKSCSDETVIEYLNHILSKTESAVLVDEKTNYNKMIRIDLAKWKDIMFDKLED